MNEYPMAAQQAGNSLSSIKGAFHDRTVRENIEAQIREAIDNVERLKNVKLSLEKSGLLDVKITDLQQAMRF